MIDTLATLAAYLSSDDSPDECMMVSDLDGFLTGVACSPDPIPAEEWLQVAFGEMDTSTRFLPTKSVQKQRQSGN